MSFRFFAGTIFPGSMFVGYRFGGGDDHGAIYAMAEPIRPGNTLSVTDQVKRRETNSTTTYFVRVNNIGSTGTEFTVTGGGVT